MHPFTSSLTLQWLQIALMEKYLPGAFAGQGRNNDETIFSHALVSKQAYTEQQETGNEYRHAHIYQIDECIGLAGAYG